ncbi:SpoIIE family protein phosphatase [Streptacidiphilus sp. N1-12]|uniref:SpoIIE family protein phosphatase n=2 Tax=Streptacidiphilus alkalitolerans TaxID=3342712 RepID=A0ABV6WWU7_9ACTN
MAHEQLPAAHTPPLAAAAHAARAGAFEWNLISGEVLWDDAVCRMLGTAPEDVEGRAAAFLEALHPDDSARMPAAVAEVIERGGRYRYGYQVVHPDGSVRRLEERGEVLLGPDGRPQRVLGLMFDRTDEGAEAGRPDRSEGTAAPSEAPEPAAGPADAFLLTLTRALARAASVDDVTRVMTDIARPALNAENLLIEAEPDALLREAAGEAMRRAIQEEQPLFLEGLQLPASSATRSWAVLPLSGSDGWRGACLFGFAGTKSFDDAQRTLFTAVAGILAHSLSRARLYDTEHQWAAELQRAMLPRRLPAVPDHSTAVRYLPGTTGMAVGGDWYDLLQLPDGRVGLVVGDVQGHSIEASAVMGQLRIALRAYAAEGHSPGVVLARTGRLLAELDTDLFATCCYLSLDPATGAVSAARAGHPQPARIHAGQGTAVELGLPGGPPLGVDPAAYYPESETVLAPGETLLLYTDGLIETRHEDIDTSLERLLATVREWVGSAPGPDPAAGTTAGWLGRLADHLVGPSHAKSPRADDVAVFLIQHDLLPEALARRPLLTA